MKKLLLAFALVAFPQVVVHAQQAPAAVCERLDSVHAQAKKLKLDIIVLEGDSLKNFRSDFQAKHGQDPVSNPAVEALVFVKVPVDGKIELGLIVYVAGCVAEVIPPGFLDARMILAILEGTPA
jgi:hypothetical protein